MADTVDCIFVLYPHLSLVATLPPLRHLATSVRLRVLYVHLQGVVGDVRTVHVIPELNTHSSVVIQIPCVDPKN